MRRTGRIVGIVIAVVVIGFLVLQLVPYGRSHTNPPVTGSPVWDSPRTQALFMTACGDCHSNQTQWPWYTNVAPASWLTQRHVDEGREKLNVSTWGSAEQDADHAAEMVRNGEMPPWDYLLMHPEARLSAADKQALADGLAATFGSEGAEGSGGESGEGAEGAPPAGGGGGGQGGGAEGQGGEGGETDD